MRSAQYKRIAVFCGSKSGNRDDYCAAMKQLAESFIDAGVSLVYGGARIGMMGALADQMLERGGEVIGVMPQSLVDREIAHEEITELHVVESMSARKSLVSQLADGFILLPGGCGSLDEFFEILTEIRLGFHNKPYGILNVNDYYSSLIKLLNHMVAEGFWESVHRDKLIVESNPGQLLKRLFKVPVAKRSLVGA